MNCECLIHPFQNDPGTSQNQRVMNDLLSDAAKIDARTLADLLDFFVQMSKHINYYDLRLNINDWQPFFKKSIPFTLASIIKFPLQNTENNLALYQEIFDKKPSANGLQLIAFSIYYRYINSINNWQLILTDSSLPIAYKLDELIKNKLQEPLKQFIQFFNAAVKNYSIKKIDFNKLSENPVWGLDATALSSIDTSFSSGTSSAHQRIINLYSDFTALTIVFNDAIKTLANLSENNLEPSFIPLKDELKKNHPPHLAVLFVFLNMFRQLQDNLNQYTRKHLDYFYKDILQFKSNGAVPDKANIVFEIQKALTNYLIKKGINVKDGKDLNKQDILFSLEDDIIVTQTSIADKRTLFLNNQTAHGQTYVEGVYMAPVAEMADGLIKPFKDDPKNVPTLGAHYSKYIDPETKLVKPYPNARIGFILASPVLLLQAGSTRTIDISLSCLLNDSICSDLEKLMNVNNTRNCCSDNNTTGPTNVDIIQYPNFYEASKFYDKVNAILATDYYYINEDIIKEAIKKGISTKIADELRDLFLTEPEEKLCYCPVKKRKYETTDPDFLTKIAAFTAGEQKILTDLIKPRRALNFLFSGEKDWIEPSAINNLELIPNTLPITNVFTLHINLTLNPDKDSVANYNKDVLIEDFGTTDPLVKVQLDDKIKFTGIDLSGIATTATTTESCCEQDKDCCLIKNEKDGDVSLYHFFRNVLIDQQDQMQTVINVEVCGLKNFIVQNDESVMDVNGPIYPFGSRPEILNFVDPTITPPNPLIGPAFYIGSEEVFFKKWDFVRINLKWKDKPADFSKYYDAYFQNGLTESKFKIMASVLDNGVWKEIGDIGQLFSSSTFWSTPPPNPPTVPTCNSFFPPDYKYLIFSNAVVDTGFIKDQHLNKKLEANTLNGFIKLNLVNQDFLHKIYAFVLARQMMAYGRFPDPVNGAIYLTGGVPSVFDMTIFLAGIGGQIIVLAQTIVSQALVGILNDLVTLLTNKISSSTNAPLLNGLLSKCIQLIDDIAIIAAIAPSVLLGGLDVTTLTQAQQDSINTKVQTFVSDLFNLLNTDLSNIETDLISAIEAKFAGIVAGLNMGTIFGSTIVNSEVLIPKEPWTPVISNISLDYSASATINDIDLIHLYPYDGTYKLEYFNLQPSLFPTYCDEGTLFLGLKDLVPGDNLNILFQMADATSDSESDPQTIYWYYLENNNWNPLRPGFEVLEDATKNLTGTGIIKFSLPSNMTSDNTVMPPDLFWIKASTPQNSGAVSETTAIIPQAIEVIFTNDELNDKSRLSQPLAAGSISKLEIADASVKSVSQPFEAFGGQVPEIEQQFYVRVSETLRHKGRAIQAFDYERLVLQAFPQVFKAKCINHSFALNAHEFINDFPYAGGYVLLAVIPDLNILKAGNSFEPKVPVSIIEDIDLYIRKRTSPFVRFRAMNPRYEKINFCLKIKLLKGKNENYYKEQVKEDIKEFLAPWAVGDYYKLTFGQCIYRSDIIEFLETRDYMDYISDLRMGKEGDAPDNYNPKICPDTPRSILIAGDIEVCIVEPYCETWSTTYMDCNDNVVNACDTKPELISNYCKK